MQNLNPEKPIIYIKAINPGYTVDGKQNVGEMIELVRPKENSDAPLSLAGLEIGYTNSNGNSVDLLEFPGGSWMAGENLLLRLSSSTSSELANLQYFKTLAQKAGTLELILDGEIIDSVCWTGKDGCYKSFDSKAPTTLVRDEETSLFSHLESYEPKYDPQNYYEETIQDETPEKQCEKLEFSEILSYYESYQSEQFIEFFNPTAEQTFLNGCKIRYKNKLFDLEGVVGPEQFFVRRLNDFSLTKNPTSQNVLELIDVDGSVADTLTYANQKKATSYAKIGYDENGEAIWRPTYAQTPGEPNIFQEFKTCEAGKVINEETGNCVKITEILEKTCKEGYFLNPETGRCKKLEIEEKKSCQEGYYLNPETGRCKKIQENTGDDYPLVPETYKSESSFIALYAIVIILALGIAYIIFQYRKEIKQLFQRVFRRSPQKPPHDSGSH